MSAPWLVSLRISESPLKGVWATLLGLAVAVSASPARGDDRLAAAANPLRVPAPVGVVAPVESPAPEGIEETEEGWGEDPAEGAVAGDGATPPAPRVYLGAGAFAHNLGQYSRDTAGSTQFLTAVFQEFSITARFPFATRPAASFLPVLAFTPFGRQSPDGNQTSRVLRLSARAAYAWVLDGAAIEPFAGVGLLSWVVSGSGGTVSLNNGNATTDFGLPDDSSMSRVFHGEAGIGVQVGNFRWDNALLVSGWLSSRRALSFSSQIGFRVF